MWGTRDHGRGRCLRRRFIPTHVGNTLSAQTNLNGVAVHPHACGEHLGVLAEVAHVVRFIPTHVGNTGSQTKPKRDKHGSSPRMWGTHVDAAPAFAGQARFIPTHVGNTATTAIAPGADPVHPHACGEHMLRITPATSANGSSPRMWGTRRPGLQRLPNPRFIPTHVGNTITNASTDSSHSGSSPRMWGTRLDHLDDLVRGRFIPTHVGNTSPLARIAVRMSVHPHACGEHVMAAELAAHNDRFIPTHVGNTVNHAGNPGSVTVHPHACGEHLLCLLVAHVGSGSSPRMWGTRPAQAPGKPPARFIPTHVGNTASTMARLPSLMVHPHACGEHGQDQRDQPRSGGSSPRMWGTPRRWCCDRGGRRFIPTHVGNTRCGQKRGGIAPVHPHACGEHPRAPRLGRQQARFIPTHVGNTSTTATWPSSTPVHPHACGEHRTSTQRKQMADGSSPRMWGTPLGGHAHQHLGRFIPTHVGNTNSTPLNGSLPSGSSPRMWGTPQQSHRIEGRLRFIPTHVGNTQALLDDLGVGGGSSPRMWGTRSCHRCRGQSATVHPHACGEHTSSNPLISMRNSGPRFSTKSGAYFELLKITVKGAPHRAGSSPVEPRHTPPEFGDWPRLCAPRIPARFSLARP